MLDVLLDLFFPRRSLSGTEGDWITDDEHKKLIVTPLLLGKDELRKRGLNHIDAVVAAGSYDQSPLLKKAILTFKYKRIPALADDLARLMNQSIDGLLLPFSNGQPPVLCPVPLHWTRHFDRGFNQSLLLASRIGKFRSWPVEDLLDRVRPTGHQARRPRAERLTALIDAFRIYKGKTPPPWVILVDDLCTTGATLDECAKALKKAGVKHVSALVAANG